MNNKIEKKMNAIVSFLNKEHYNLSNKNKDGRVNSIKNEGEILDILDKKFDIVIPESRDWADFYVEDTPVNIKITTTETADNTSSKKGIYYSLTGKTYCGSQDWDTYLKKLSQNIKDTDKDYYFLIVNKNNLDGAFFNGLKGLKSIVPNGNNLPFQVKWKENSVYIKQPFLQSKKIILGALEQSLKKRADAYSSFKKYFPNN